MLGISYRQVVRTRYEFAVDAPATQRDVSDAVVSARVKLKELGGDPEYDDAIMVDARDDEIVVYFDREKE